MIAFFLSVLVLAIATLAFLSLYIWPNEYQRGDSETTLAPPEEENSSVAPGSREEPAGGAPTAEDRVTALNKAAPGLQMDLPDDIPHRGWLEAGGIQNLNDLIGREDLTEISYIGPERAADVQAYLAEEVYTISE
jgi:hypothetical protein